jgi:hypothetical protein
MRRFCLVLVIPALVGLLLLDARAAEGPGRQVLVASSLMVNPNHVLAVYRPIENQAITVLIGRPGQAVQAITVTDVREAAAIFDSIWKNDQVTKNPGESDARPLTRMVPKDAEGATATLIVNVERVLAIKWDAGHQVANVYLDMPAGAAPLVDPNNADREGDSLEITNERRQAEAVMEAYKACILAGPAKDNK